MDKNIASSSHVEDAAPEQSYVSVWQSLRYNSKAVLFCIGPCIGSMLWGFDIGSYEHDPMEYVQRADISWKV